MTVLDDLRFGIRLLARSPGFTITVLATLALGVGLNSAIFSMVSAILLRPLPYRDAERIVTIDELHPRLDIEDPGVSAVNLMDWRAQSRCFEEMSVFNDLGLNLTGVGEPERLEGAAVTAGWFGVLSSGPAYGRLFGAEENGPGAARSVVLSWGLWQRRFGGNPSAIGRAVVLNGKPFTVAGVMPAGFGFQGKKWEAWVPFEVDPQGRGAHGPNALGKLKPGVTRQQAQAELDTIEARLAAQYPEARGWKVRIGEWHDRVVGSARTPLLVLMGAVGFVLLIACANVANLLLARAPARRREIVVRAALGAGRGRIVRQLLVESLLLGAAGGVLGLAVGRGGLALLAAGVAKGLPRVEEVRMDFAVLAFTMGLALTAALVFGLAPALETARADLAAGLKEGGRGGPARRGHGLRNALVAGEVALSLILLIGAVLLVRGFLRLMHTDPGFRAENVLTMKIELPASGYGEPSRRAGFYRQLLENVAHIPGVRAAGVTDSLPMRSGSGWGVEIEGQPPPKPGQLNLLLVARVSPDYARAMGIRLLRGRGVSERDAWGAPLVAVVNEAMARRNWPGEDPIGKRFRPSGSKDWFTVVGTSADVRLFDLKKPGEPAALFPYLQDPQLDMHLALRTVGDPAALAAAARRAVREVDPNQPVASVETMDQIIGESLATPRVYAALLSFFGALALVLALVGIYGVISSVAAERTREIGIRMALGAQRGAVLRMVLGHAMLWVGLGLAVGLGGALALTRVLESALFGVRARDAATYAAAAAAVLGVGLAAAWLPARRAAGVDPSTVLRDE